MNLNIPHIHLPNPNMESIYPLSSFHLIVFNAAKEVRQHIQAPDAMIGMTFLTVMSVASQGLIDVMLPTGQRRPVSLDIAQIADSGEGKTALEAIVSASIYSFDESRAKKYKADLVHYYTDIRFWKSVSSGINRQITKLAQTDQSLDELYQKLREHNANKPVKPRLRRIIRQNVTEKAIMEALQGDGESIAIMSDEGEIILKGGAMKQIGFLNKLWDGAKSITFDRAGDENLVATNPRTTISFMVQKAVLQEYLERHGDVTRGSGHWARYLIGWPETTRGMRVKSYQDTEWVFLPKFHARVTELLEEYGRRIDAGVVEHTVIEFSDEAKIRWIDKLNQTESMLAPCGYLYDIKDFASKAMEIVGRVAGLMHLFSNQESKITVDTFERALDVVRWHLHEFKRIFSPQLVVPADQVDANAVRNYLQTHYAHNGFMTAPKNAVLNNGPVRPIKRLDAALDYLVMLDQIRIVPDEKRKRFIKLNPQFFGPLVRM